MATEVSPLLQSIPPQPTTPGVDRLLHVGSEVDRPLYVGSADDNVNGDVQESVKISETRDMIQHSASYVTNQNLTTCKINTSLPVNFDYPI